MRDISAFTFSSSRVLYGLGPLWILVSNVGVDSPIRGGTTTRSRLVGLFTCRRFGIPHSVTTCGATILSIVAWDRGAEAFRSMIQVFSHMQDGLQPNLVARYRFHTKRLRQNPFIYSLISAFLRLFFHVKVFTHLKVIYPSHFSQMTWKRLCYGTNLYWASLCML